MIRLGEYDIDEVLLVRISKLRHNVHDHRYEYGNDRMGEVERGTWGNVYSLLFGVLVDIYWATQRAIK